MAYEGPATHLGTLTAQVDLSAWQFKPVKIGTTGTADKADATADIPIGILQNKPEAGASCDIIVFGPSKAIAGETLVIGEIVGIQVTSGEVITAASTMYPLGTCLVIAGNAETATVMVNPSNTVKA